MDKFVSDSKKAIASENMGIVEAVARHLDETEEVRRTDAFHISELFKFCPIQWVMDRIVKKPKHIPYRLRYRFDIGHALHAMVQRYLGDMGVLKGYWKCENGHKTNEISLKPKKCAECGDDRLRYREIKIEHEVAPGHKIAGRPDGVIVWDDEDMALEIKSIESDVLPMLKKPYPYPIYQMRMYMHLLRQEFFPKMKKGVVLLVAGSLKDCIILPIKTFMVDYSDVPWNEAVEKVEKALAYWDQYEKGDLSVGDLISERICANKTAGKKMECQFVEECFSTANLTKILTVDPSKV